MSTGDNETSLEHFKANMVKTPVKTSLHEAMPMAFARITGRSSALKNNSALTCDLWVDWHLSFSFTHIISRPQYRPEDNPKSRAIIGLAGDISIRFTSHSQWRELDLYYFHTRPQAAPWTAPHAVYDWSAKLSTEGFAHGGNFWEARTRTCGLLRRNGFLRYLSTPQFLPEVGLYIICLCGEDLNSCNLNNGVWGDCVSWPDDAPAEQWMGMSEAFPLWRNQAWNTTHNCHPNSPIHRLTHAITGL